MDYIEVKGLEVFGMMSIVNDMESIGDIIHRITIPLIAPSSIRFSINS